MVIESEDDVVGCAALYEYSKTSETIWLDLVLADGLADTDLVRRQAASELVASAFRNWSVRKLYAGHLSCDRSPLADLGAKTHEEGRIRESVLHDDLYHDRFIVALHHDSWNDGDGPGETS